MIAAGTSIEEIWKSEEGKEQRDNQGEQSEEAYEKATRDTLGTMVCCPHPNPTEWITFVNNNDIKNFEGIKEINKVLSLEWENVDADEIAKVNMERMKNLRT